MTEEITIVDRGRGHQLSTCRITVLDLVRYFRNGSSYEEIIRWIPTLSRDEISVAEAFYLEHKAEFDEQDRRAVERREAQIRLQRQSFPKLDGTREEQLHRLQRLMEKRRREKNGEGHPGRQ
jgi:uncharacterized protein (DUF433 family)